MRRVETLILILALGFYGWFLDHFGLSRAIQSVRLVGWGLLATIVLESVSRLANTIGWRVTIVDRPRELSFGALFVARIAGEAIDYVTPSAQLGGQFVKALMVRRQLAMAVALATVIVASLAEAVGQIGFISGALVIALPSEARLHHLFWPVAAGMTIALGLAGGFFFVQLKEPFSHVWKVAAKLDIPQLADPEVQAAAGDADALLTDFYANRRARFVLACCCYLVAWSMGPIEIVIYLRLLHQPFTWMTPLLVDALGLLVERATFLIPGKLVSQEGGKALVMGLLGYPAAVGFALGLLRRLKELAWVMFGLIALSVHRMTTERSTAMAKVSRQNLIKMRGAHEGEMS
jgi:glycosyltransferase 2 family protein